MSRLSLRKKLWIPLMLAWFGLLAITVVNAIQNRDQQMHERRVALANVVDMPLSLVKDYADKAQRGELTVEQAKEQAARALSVQRFGKDGYVSITASDMVTVMHPINPKLNGKYQGDVKDPNGVMLYREINKVGSSPAGTGFVNYMWPKPGATEPGPKLSYVARFAPWGWDLIAGVYLDDIEAEFRGTVYRAVALLLVLGIALSVVGWLMTRSILRAVGGEPEEAANVAMRIAEGDLAVRVAVQSGDTSSLVYAIDHMRAQLAGTVTGIHSAADSITSAAREISAGNTDLSSRTEQQAASLQETAASMEQLTTTVRQNADNARMATELVGNAAKIAQQGGSVVNSVVEKMHGITASSNKINEITSVIDSIAFQTNILALNAAVEAARAGEQGRGFAVVAGEVRTLAQRSASAAREIKSLIDESATQVESGAALVEQAGRTMADVVTAVSRVTVIMEGIDTASQEQRTGIEEVNRAVTQMDEVTQQNAALVEEATAAAASLEDQADSLYRAISVFRVAA